MGFSLHGNVIFYCKVEDWSKPKFEVHVKATASLDFVEGLVIDDMFIDAIGFHDVEQDSWKAAGTVGGKVSVTSGDIGGTIGARVKFTFDTSTGYWGVVAGISYTSKSFNMTVDVGTESQCTEEGTFIDGAMTFLLPIPAMDEMPEPGSGSIYGVARCGPAAVDFGKFQLHADVATLTVQIEQLLVYIHDLSIDVDVMIPEGKHDSMTEFAEYDFYVRIVGRILLGTDFNFTGAELLNALTPDVGIDFYGELIGGELRNVNITLVADIEYKLPAKNDTWQKKLGVDELNIYSHLKIAYPCPNDGIAMIADIKIEAYMDSFNISKGTGTIKYDCRKKGRIDITAYIGTLKFQTGAPDASGATFQIRSVDFELHIENAGSPALGVLRGDIDSPSYGAGVMHQLAGTSAADPRRRLLGGAVASPRRSRPPPPPPPSPPPPPPPPLPPPLLTPLPPPFPPPPLPPPPPPPGFFGDYLIYGKISAVFAMNTPEVEAEGVEGTDNYKMASRGRGLQITVSVYFDLPKALYALAVKVKYKSDMVYLKLVGHLDLDLSKPDQPEFCDIDMKGFMKLDLPRQDVSDTANNTNITKVRGDGLDLIVVASSSCPKQDGVSKYAVEASVENWSLLDGMFTGEKLEVRGKVWTYGDCLPDLVTAQGITSADPGRMGKFPGEPLEGTMGKPIEDARQVRLLSGVALGRSLDPRQPVTCGQIVADTRSTTKSPSASASYWIFVACQQSMTYRRVKFIALTVNIVDGVAYLQATDAGECTTNCAPSTRTSTSAHVAEYFKKGNHNVLQGLNVASTSEEVGLGVKHITWETFEAADCDALKVGWCTLKPVETRVETAWFQSLK